MLSIYKNVIKKNVQIKPLFYTYFKEVLQELLFYTDPNPREISCINNYIFIS